MTETSRDAQADGQSPGPDPGKEDSGKGRQRLLPPPGLAAIALYLLLLAANIALGVTAGHRYPPIFLLFSILLFAASGGLLMLFRWAWALGLAAVVLLSSYNLWIWSRQHLSSAFVQGSLNLVFFLYLVRADVRKRLR
jgi:hypothetical protein